MLDQRELSATVAAGAVRAIGINVARVAGQRAASTAMRWRSASSIACAGRASSDHVTIARKRSGIVTSLRRSVSVLATPLTSSIAVAVTKANSDRRSRASSVSRVLRILLRGGSLSLARSPSGRTALPMVRQPDRVSCRVS